MEPYRLISIGCDIRSALWPWGVANAEPKASSAREGRARTRRRSLGQTPETFQDADAKQKMREIAAKYEELAERLEKAAADEP
jgi:hypothetical protein